MVRRFLSLLCLFSLFTALLPFSIKAETIVHFDQLLSDEELTNTQSLSKEDLQSFLKRGSLADYRTRDVNGVERFASDIIWRAAQEFRLSPRFLLVLLQREQSLIEDDFPTQDQLDWATGYAICDSCSKNDPAIQKYRGFGPQVYYAAQRIRESYLGDLHENGQTLSGVGPGIPTVIDGVTVIPSNKATAALYTYTPHLEGNENFVRIWRRWFIPDYPNGSLLKNKKGGAFWLIQNGERRSIASRSVFVSRFRDASILSVDASVINTYPIGTSIRFPNYSLLRSPRGTVYLTVDDTRRGIASQEAFRALGFNSDEIEDVTEEDLNIYQEGVPITVETVMPQGNLLQNNKTGGVYYVEDGQKHAISSKEILNARFPSEGLTLVSSEKLEGYPTAEPITFPDGTLLGLHGKPEIYVVSDGWRRHITNEDTFTFFGWRWNQIVWTDERSLHLHPEGEPLTRPNEEEKTL